jgi:hypothetical protein
MMDLHELRILQEAFLKCTRENFYENEEEAVEIDMDQNVVATEEPETDVDELPEEKDTETKIHELLDCPEMEAAHEFLYDIDYDEITDKQIDKVNKLYDLAIKHEFIKSEVETENPEAEETEDDSSIEDTEIEDEAPVEDDTIEDDESEEEITDEEEPVEEEPADEESEETTPDEDETTDDDESVEEIPADAEEETSDTEQDEPVEEEPKEEPVEEEPAEEEEPEEDILEDSEEVSIVPDVPSETAESAFTCLYSAMKNGELKTGEVYSNAVDAESAKADAISKLVSLGFTSIEIIAIENGDPANIGKANTVFDPLPSDEVLPDEEFTPITEAEETDVEEEEEEDSEEKDESETEPVEEEPVEEEPAEEEKPEENDTDLTDQEKEELKADFVKLWKNSLKSIERESYTDLDMSEKAKFWDTINSHWEKEFDPNEFISNNDFAKIEALKITL